MRSQRVSDTSAHLDAKPTGERCLYSTARRGWGAKNRRGPEGQGLQEPAFPSEAGSRQFDRCPDCKTLHRRVLAAARSRDSRRDAGATLLMREVSMAEV